MRQIADYDREFQELGTESRAKLEVNAIEILAMDNKIKELNEKLGTKASTSELNDVK